MVRACFQYMWPWLFDFPYKLTGSHPPLANLREHPDELLGNTAKVSSKIFRDIKSKILPRIQHQIQVYEKGAWMVGIDAQEDLGSTLEIGWDVRPDPVASMCWPTKIPRRFYCFFSWWKPNFFGRYPAGSSGNLELTVSVRGGQATSVAKARCTIW